MKEFNYRQKINNATTQIERNKINNDYMKHRRKIHKYEYFKKFCKDNLFNIINSILALSALVVAILSLLLQIPKQ